MSIEAISAARKLELAPRDKFVLIALADYANDQGEAWPGQNTISEWTCYDRSTVNSALRALEKAGLIKSRQTYRDDGGKSVKVYRLTFLPTPHVGRGNKGHVAHAHIPHVADTDIPHVAERNKGMSATPTTPSGPGQHPHVAESNNKNHQEGTTNKEPPQEQARASARQARSTKNSKTKKIRLGDFDPLTIHLPEFINPDRWKAFATHRAEIRKPLTESATKITLEQLAKHPNDADRMLETSIQRGWTGVFPLDGNRSPSASPAAQAWDQILDSARKGKPPDNLDPAAKAALKHIGGWSAVAYCPEHLLAHRRRQFLDAHTTPPKPLPTPTHTQPEGG